MNDQLTLWTEQDETALRYNEQVIEDGLETYMKVGQALMEIRDNRLYRKEFQTFEEYCREKWGRSRRWANRIIKSSEVAGVIGNGTHGSQIPETERQARPLTKLDNPMDQAEAWGNAVANSKTGQPTAKEVEAEVERLRTELAQKTAQAKALEGNQKQLEKRVQDLAMVVNAGREKLTKAEEEKQKAIVAALAEKEESYGQQMQQLQDELMAKEKAIKAEQKRLERFKANPDPETKKKIEEAHAALIQLEGDRRSAEARLNKLRTQEDHARTNAIKFTRLKGAIEKVIADHSDGVLAISSPYMTESLLCDAEMLANALHDFAARIEQSIDASRHGDRQQAKTVQVEVL